MKKKENWFRITILTSISVLLIAAASIVLPQNGTISIDWWLIGSGGGSTSGGDYSLESTIGQPVVGSSSGGDYSLASGFLPGLSEPAVVFYPEMDVQGNGLSITDGDSSSSVTDDTDFVDAEVGVDTVAHTFTIENTGDDELNLTGTPKVEITGANASDFTVTSVPASPVAASGGMTAFEITFDPSAEGLREVYRPSNGRWYIEGQGNFKWGYAGDLPVPGDYDGDGTTDIAIFRPSNGKWYVMGSAPASWGTAGDIPMQADYTGDGLTDKAVLRTSTKRWYIQGIGNIKWYYPGDIPVPCDYDGDGTTDIAIFRPSNNKWYVMGDSPVGWGQSGDIPVPADYDGDGACEIAVFRPSNGVWYVMGVGSTTWGLTDDIPVPGDYDGDGDTEYAVLRPSNGKWYIKDVGTFSWYASGDFPLPVRDTNADGYPYQ